MIELTVDDLVIICNALYHKAFLKKNMQIIKKHDEANI